LSTKRVGRDDDQIASDREIAREARLNRTQKQRGTAKPKAVAASKKKSAPKKARHSRDSSSDESMGSFVVDDEEHEEELSESEADWDDELEDDDDEDDDDDSAIAQLENDVNVTASSKRRKRLGKPAVGSNGSSVSVSVSVSPSAGRSKKRMEIIECSSDSDSDSDSDCDEKKSEDPLPTNKSKKVTSSFFSKVPPLKKMSSSSSSDELDIIDSPPARRPLQSAAAKRLRQEQMARNMVNHEDDSSSSEDEDLFGKMKHNNANPPVGKQQQLQLQKQSRASPKESDSDYEEKIIEKNDTDEDEEEEDPMLKRAIQQSLRDSHKQAGGHSSLAFLCDSSDEDTEAIALAKKASLKDLSKKRLRKGKSNDELAQTNSRKTQKLTKRTKTTKVRTKVVEVLSSSSDDDEGNGNDDEKQESYNYEEEEDANHKEASKVLQIANSLSATVLNRMQSWAGQVQQTQTQTQTKTSGHDDDRGGGGGTKLPELIVDGALSLVRLHRDIDDPVQAANANMESAQGQAATSSMGERWISNDTMCRLCPKIKLADYQLIGVNWMALLHSMKCDLTQKNGDMVASGNADSEDDDDEEYGKAPKKKSSRNGKKANVNGVLADEMGLGKTVQTIAFLAWLKFGSKKAATANGRDVVSSNKSRPHIIVVPASVLGNWEKEFKIVCPELVVVKYHGPMSEREQIRYRLKKVLAGRMPLDVILTTYSYFSGEKADDRNFLRKFHYEYMIVDEAHCLKNPRGMRYQNLDRVNTEHRLLLTGTPVQNSPKELMSLLCFLMPLFSSQQSRDDRDGGEEMLEHFISIENENVSKKDAGSDRDREARAYMKLKQLLAPFILRRLKCNVGLQGLPPKVRKVEFVPFDKSSRSLYDSVISSHLSRGTKDENSETTDADHCQHIFTALRKAANHPLLLRTRHKSKEDINDLSNILFLQGYFGRDATCTEELVKRELKKFSDFDVHCAAIELIKECKALEPRLSRYTLSEEDLFCSPKFARLRSLVPKLVAEGHRVLIFSQWTRCLDLLGCMMDSIQLQFLRLDGQTDIKERQSMIDEFNNDPSIPIFLLSTRAGGLGLNLAAADTVILHDLDFNPFNDIQAEDRCHRFGQTKVVTVYKLVTEGTVDADIYAMQERKARMNAAIFENEGESTGKKKAKKKSEEKEAMASIVQTAVDRFLLSPSK